MPEKRSQLVDARNYYQIANDYYEKGDYEKAIENYNTAILLNPVFSEAYFNRALSGYQLKNYEKSIADYTKAIELDPKNPIIFNNRGDAFYRKQDYSNAIKDYDKAVTLNPSYLKAYYNRALSYASLEDYDRAVEDFTKVVELKPDFAEAYHLRGLAREYEGDIESAIVDYEKALKLDPALSDAKAHLESAKGKQSGEGATAGKGDIRMLEKPSMTFVDVAGMEKLKEEIRDSIVYPLLKPDLARRYGKLGGGGILLYGPPGCGKTYIVKASAGEGKAGFINAKLSDLLDMYVGNTEKNIHKVFELARKNIPSIIFFDEVDAIGSRRDSGGEGGGQALKMAVNQLLYELDGVESHNENVLVIAATNAPWDVDPALRRSGRFTKSIYVPAPGFKSRLAILKLHSKKRPMGRIAFVRIALATYAYASSDLKAIVEDAAAIPWKEAFRTGKERKITTGDFIKALSKKKSSLPPWYGQANKQIGKVEEITIIDGKEHKKVSESKMGPEERAMFSPLLKIIEHRSKWYYKIWVWIAGHIGLWIPIPF